MTNPDVTVSPVSVLDDFKLQTPWPSISIV
jgi:hypothetical protein